MTFPLTVYTDQSDPELSAISDPISFKITKDVTVLEDVEYFQAHIVETSSESQVKIARPNTVNITIIEDKSESLTILQCQCFNICNIITFVLVVYSHHFWCKTPQFRVQTCKHVNMQTCKHANMQTCARLCSHIYHCIIVIFLGQVEKQNTSSSNGNKYRNGKQEW